MNVGRTSQSGSCFDREQIHNIDTKGGFRLGVLVCKKEKVGPGGRPTSPTILLLQIGNLGEQGSPKGRRLTVTSRAPSQASRCNT